MDNVCLRGGGGGRDIHGKASATSHSSTPANLPEPSTYEFGVPPSCEVHGPPTDAQAAHAVPRMKFAGSTSRLRSRPVETGEL